MPRYTDGGGFPGDVLIVGLGHIGRALATGLAGSEVIPADRLIGWDTAADRLESPAEELGIRRARSLTDSIGSVGLIVVAVKPRDVRGVAEALAGKIGSGSVLLSVAAGVELSRIRSWIGASGLLARAMPNLPVSIRHGALAVTFEEGFPAEKSARLKEFLSGLGMVVEVDERLLDSVTGLSASGPAYVALLVEAMAEAGVAGGLPWDISLQLVLQTFLGTAGLLKETGQDPSAFRRRVTTPGGTTIAGLRELERGTVRGAIMTAVEAAVKRAGELARTAD